MHPARSGQREEPRFPVPHPSQSAVEGGEPRLRPPLFTPVRSVDRTHERSGQQPQDRIPYHLIGTPAAYLPTTRVFIPVSSKEKSDSTVAKVILFVVFLISCLVFAISRPFFGVLPIVR